MTTTASSQEIHFARLGGSAVPTGMPIGSQRHGPPSSAGTNVVPIMFC